MFFLKPSYLYLLFLIPILLLLYLLRLRRRTHIVSSSIFWEQDIEDIKANTPFQRLRKNVLLPLQILFLMLIIFALARPFWTIQGETAGDVILIIDKSASMKATDVEPTRFESVRSWAMKIIGELGLGRKMMIIEAGKNPGITIGFTTDKARLQKAVDKMKPMDAPSDLENAIQLASSIARDAKGSRVILLSDGATKFSKKIEDIDMALQFMKFGENDWDNISITAFEVERSSSDPSKIQAFVALRNFGVVKKQDVSLELYHDADLIDVRALSLIPKERRSVIFDGIQYTEGILKAVIDVKDNLPTDNSAYYVLKENRPSKILLVSKGNLFLREAIKVSFPVGEITYQDPESYYPIQAYDLIIFDSFIPEKIPDGNLMLVNSRNDLPFGKLLSRADNPKIINWDRDNPIMRFVDLSNLRIDRGFSYQMPVWISPLVESDMGAIIWTGENSGNRMIILPFEIRPGLSNNFPMLPAFPIFMSNAVNWLLWTERGYSQQQIKSGEPIKISVPESLLNQNITMKKPDGQEESFKINDRTFIYMDTDEVGIYSITGNGLSEKFAVNLLDELESNIEPKEKIQIGSKEFTSSSASVSNTREIWGILVLIGIAILAVEWWAYHRRILV